MPPRILRLSLVLWWVVTLLLPGLPLLVLLWGWHGVREPGWLLTAFPGLPPETRLTAGKSSGTLALGLLALVPMLAALWHMRGLFALYAASEVLTPMAARRIRAIGVALALLAVAQTVLPGLQLLLLTADNPPGARIVSIALTSEMLWLALAGGLLVTIGWAMTEAARVAEENRGFV
ncbi:hypothetical protein IQ03_02808 [Gemmobacter caeni]|uniref:DUF2975 family protein n=2 Tax=Gemmobacter TaxID=204456 RepID=A0A2T6B2R4_9RHOB|nr:MULTISPECIES: DUF2975 domain-containing protein [Gemmobacter]PTX50370.1 hypothetical protein C8N34_10513 [Gemmobacter caeni]TWI98413.1 hypothetical protein IQ03_02808 [Gemmobacter caeni]GHC27144.1 hypothetical protein GCM10007291_28810 [Gemmobacter nanjingensis]